MMSGDNRKRKAKLNTKTQLFHIAKSCLTFKLSLYSSSHHFLLGLVFLLCPRLLQMLHKRLLEPKVIAGSVVFVDIEDVAGEPSRLSIITESLLFLNLCLRWFWIGNVTTQIRVTKCTYFLI